jgi:hypothetical protein
MILVILGVSIALFIGGFLVCEKTYCDETGFAMCAVGGLCGFVALIFTVVLCCCNAADCRIDEKIAMYTEENTRIEQQIANCVERYQEYEQGVFEKVSPDNAVTLVSLYPELKSDTLVQAQIETYVKNNNKIKELKEHKIDAYVRKWWLYFGGEDDG